MVHRYAYKAFNRSERNVMRMDLPFGSKLVAKGNKMEKKIKPAPAVTRSAKHNNFCSEKKTLVAYSPAALLYFARETPVSMGPKPLL